MSAIGAVFKHVYDSRTMIRTELLADTGHARIVLRGDGEWTWQANAPVIGSLALVSLLLAVVTVSLGAWVVPLFSGFEIAMLILATGVCLKRTNTQEVLTFSKLMLKFERGRDEPEETVHIERFYARFLVRYPRSRLDRPEVRLQYQRDGQRHQLRIGEFLNTDEVIKLEKALGDVIQRFDR
ncbi:MAG: DUF2244 domain-containing protein [Gammaproteobacteria bacterium]|nr:DUF2244 domain-containing protein [Gammaproteobacteria bacterium]MCY4198230.1 DUF2244 domain-containing protein [Gammaproteobacteria bacterium]